MTRINTNVSSLNAQKSLARSNMQLQQALTRLSTGLRINVGKDDPAGLIASEVLRSDITSVQQAITNSERANQMIATADSAMGQISSLLNDVRGLISEAANEGAMSADQIAANQMQVDSSLEAIDRIVQVTQFQGKRLLDGNMGFVTENVDSTKISDLDIQQAVFGTSSQISVGIEVVAQATKGQLAFSGNTISEDVVLEVGGTKGFEAFSFAAGSAVADMTAAINLVSDALGVTAEVDSVVATSDGTGQMNLTNVGGSTGVNVQAATAGEATGDYAIKYVLGPDGGTTVSWNAASGDDPAWLQVNLESTDWAAANVGDLALGGTATMDLVAKDAGDQYNGMSITIVDDDTGNTATYDPDANVMTVTVDITGVGDDIAEIVAAINAELGHLFTASDAQGATAAIGVYANVFATGTAGVTGDVIQATSAQVAAQINAEDELTATGGSTDVIQHVLTDYAYLGSMNTGTSTDQNNHVQLIGPSLDALPVSLVNNGASQELQVQFEENRVTGGYAQVIIQSTAADASLKVTAKNRGTDYNGVGVRFIDTNGTGQADGVAYDAQNKEIRVYADFTGNMTSTQVRDLINNDTEVGALFEAETFGTAGATFVDIPDAGDEVMGTTSRGELYDAVNIQLATDASGAITTTAANLIDYINNSSAEMAALGITASNAGSSTGTGAMEAQSANFATVGVTRWTNDFAQGSTYASNGPDAAMTVKALTAGTAYEDVKITFRDRGADAISVSYDADAKELNIYVNGTSDTVNDVVTAFTATSNPTEYYLFQLSAAGLGDQGIELTDTGWLTGSTTTTGSSKGVSLVGNWDEGDILGTEGLQFSSQEYGSSQFVSIKALSGTFAVTNSAGTTADRSSGTDVNVRVNGIQAIGDGLKASINTSALDLSFYIDAAVVANTTTSFTITGGGAQFQLGPDVVSNQQARIAIQSMSAALLGGNTGRLYQLRSGEDFALDTDTRNAAAVAEEAISKVSSLRGRLGAFQMTTLDANIATLNDTLESLTEAESSIRDADFAAESANLTRAQILVQSGISVLAIANSNPQSILALLR